MIEERNLSVFAVLCLCLYSLKGSNISHLEAAVTDVLQSKTKSFFPVNANNIPLANRKTPVLGSHLR